VMVAALLLQIVQSYAVQTAALGSAIMTVDAVNMVLIAVLVFLVLRQVMPIASGLAGGASLNSFGLTSRMIGSALRPTSKVAKAGAVAALGLVGESRERRPKGDSAAVRSGSSPDGKADASRDTVGANWRDMRP
jgi:type IV secretion system protein VirB6